jgi:peptidyl-prolyl cis-trans isomerase SurA
MPARRPAAEPAPLIVPMPIRPSLAVRLAASLSLAVTAFAVAAQGPARAPVPLAGDYIVVVVNQEVVTAGEIQQRMRRAAEGAARAGQRVPPEAELRRFVLDGLIEERVIITHARDSGLRVEDADIDRALQGIAAQNQMTPAQMRERLRAQGVDFARFRAEVRDQLLIERVREREVYQRIRVSDGEIDAWIEQRRTASLAGAEFNVAQILVTVPAAASPEAVAERRARAEAARARVQAGEAFDAVAREVSEDANRERGGEIGLRPAARLPDVFVAAVRSLSPGAVAPELVRSDAGFHVLKLVDRRGGSPFAITQSRVRHILLRTSPQVTADQAVRRLEGIRQQIAAGTSFEQLAREVSEDGSASAGGDLGWASPGMMVPEFEEAMNRLPVGNVSAPVVSRFGVHLIQVLERREVELEPRQLREQARNVLREQKFEAAYEEWARDLRGRAYIEMREPPA